MSDPTMELIRRANPYPDGLPPLPIESVMRRMGEDGSRQPLATQRMPLFSSGGALAVVSVVVALAVAVLAITTLSHRHSETVAPGSVSSSRQQLLQTLGVLRRPQTKTDLLATRPGGVGGELPGIFRVRAAGACRGRNSPVLPCTLRLETSLVREVKVGDGYRAAIFPTQIERSTAQAQRGEGVVLAVRGPGLYIITSMTPTGVPELRDQGLLLSAYVASGVDQGIMLVPDGVARLTLDHFRLLAPYAGHLPQIPPTRSTVKDNFARLQITGLTEKNLHLNPHTLGRYFAKGSGTRCRTTFAVYSLPATAEMTWVSVRHILIRHVTINLRLDVGTHHPAPGTTDTIPPRLRPSCPR